VGLSIPALYLVLTVVCVVVRIYVYRKVSRQDGNWLVCVCARARVCVRACVCLREVRVRTHVCHCMVVGGGVSDVCVSVCVCVCECVRACVCV
jgi:hypothetical protein